MQYWILAFYSVTPLEQPEKAVLEWKEFFASRDLMGRIYLSLQGINAQMSASEEAAKEFLEWLESRYGDLGVKIHQSDRHVFPKKTIKYRKQLVALDRPVDLSNTGRHVSAAEWREMLEKRDEETIVLDVRNDYEWKVGHFEGSELPALSEFRQFPKWVSELKEKRNPKKTKVMMCCTGGIRCEFFSALMKEEGFEDVVQLKGGVVQYGIEEGNRHWKGKLFVFDDRLVVPISQDEAPPIGVCIGCGTLVDVYYNCANSDCNRLYVSCGACHEEKQGCCSKECRCAPRLRAFKSDPTPYRKLCAH
jgi:UPF0176 protein